MQTFKLEDMLAYRAVFLAQGLSQSLSLIYKEHLSLSTPEWRIMATVKQKGECRAKDIAALTLLDKVKVSRATQRLVERGFVIKRQDKSDKRVFHLSLSVLGEETYASLVPKIEAWQANLKSGISEHDFNVFSQVLGQLTRNAESTRR